MSLPSWEMSQHPAVGLAPQPQPGKQLQWWCHTQAGTGLPAGHLPMGASPCEPEAGGLIAAQALL